MKPRLQVDDDFVRPYHTERVHAAYSGRNVWLETTLGKCIQPIYVRTMPGGMPVSKYTGLKYDAKWFLLRGGGIMPEIRMSTPGELAWSHFSFWVSAFTLTKIKENT
jgi:hypothetical protein